MDVKLQELEATQLRRAVEGNQASLSWLLSFYQKRLLQYVGAILPADLKNTMEPDDLVQVIHIEVSRQIQNFQPSDEPDCFFHWLSTIARRRSIDAIRKVRAAKRGQGMTRNATAIAGDTSKVLLLEQLLAHADTPSGIMAGQEALSALDEAIADLPEQYHRVVQMYHLEQQPIEIVAKELGKSEAATYKIAQRAVHLLRTLMGQRSKFM